MSNVSGNTTDGNSVSLAWNRTPGKPNCASLSTTAVTQVSWVSRKNILSSNSVAGDISSLDDVWSNIPESTNICKLENTALWPTPAEVAGNLHTESALEAPLINAWNSSSRTVPTTQQFSSDLHTPSHIVWSPNRVPRAVTGQQVISSPTNNELINLSGNTGKHKNESTDCFSTWSSQPDVEISAFQTQHTSSGSNTFVGKQENPPLSAEGSGMYAATGSSISDSGNHTDGHCLNNSVVNALVNTKECWGQRPVDQSTPWDVSIIATDENDVDLTSLGTTSMPASSPQSGLLGDAVAVTMQNQQRRLKGGSAKQPSNVASVSSFESNVWPNEPPTGTGIWETHYESIGERTARWKQASTRVVSTPSSPCISRLPVDGINGSPPGSLVQINRPTTIPNPSVPTSVMLSSYHLPVSINQPFLSPNQRNLGASGSIFNFGGYGPPNPQARFRQPGIQFPANSIRNAISNGSNAIFRQIHASPISPMPPNWQISLPDGTNNVGSWIDNASYGRPIGKQMTNCQSMNNDNCNSTRWPSPIHEIMNVNNASVSNWSPTDTRKLASVSGGGEGNWNQIPFSNVMPPLNQQQQQQTSSFPMPRFDSSNIIPPRFHSNNQQQPQTQPTRQQCPQRGLSMNNTAPHTLLRTNIMRSLFNLGFPDEAQSLVADVNIDIEKLLCDLRDRTGHPAFSQLISTLSTPIPISDSFSSTDLTFENNYENTSSTRDQMQQNNLSKNNSPTSVNKFGRGGPQNPDVAVQLLQHREAQTLQNIVQLHMKNQDLVQKQMQLRRMNIGSPPNPMVQELQQQVNMISRQIDGQQSLLKQLRGQGALLKQMVVNGMPNSSVVNHSNAQLNSPGYGEELIGGGGGENSPYPIGMTRMVPSSHMQIPTGIMSCQPNRAMMINQDMVNRMTDMKLSQTINTPHLQSLQIDMRRPLSWEAGVWSGVNQGLVNSTTGNQPSDLPVMNNSEFNQIEDNARSSNPLGGDRRWAPDSGNDSYWVFNNRHEKGALSGDLSNTCGGTTGCWLSITDLASHISVETLKMAVTTALSSLTNATPRSPAPSTEFEIHPNLASRSVLLGFVGIQEAKAVANFIANNAMTSGIKLGSTEIISSSKALLKLQEIKNLAGQLEDDSSSNPSSWIRSSVSCADNNSKHTQSNTHLSDSNAKNIDAD